MSIRILLLILTPVLFACKGGKNGTSGEVKEPTRAVAPVVKFGGEGRTDSLFLSMERTPCFGVCKAYRIHVYRSGYATFEGRSNVEKEGMHEARIGKDTLALLLNEAERLTFFDLDTLYDSNVTDLPSTIIRVVGNGKDKRVKGRYNMPERFKTYGTFVDGLLFPVPWKPIAGKN